MNQSKLETRNSNLTKGNAWVGILLLLVFTSALAVGLVSDAAVTINQSKRAQQTTVAQALADAGVDKAIWKLNKTPGYIGESDIVLPTGMIDIAISNIDANNKQVIATAYVPSKSNARVTRKVRAMLTASADSEGIAFKYGIQVGSGGVELGNGTTIYGNVYSNSFINGAGINKSEITGDAYAVTTITDVKTKSSHTGQPPTTLPNFDTALWQNLANQNNNPINGSHTQTGGHFGPRRVNGDLNLNGVIIDGPVYATGNVTVGGNMSLNSNFGSSGTVILSDGAIDISANTVISATTANPKGYLLFATSSVASPAINLGTDMAGGVFFALNGIIHTQPHVNPVSLTAKGISMQPNGELHYDEGLASTDFTDGPGGSWILKEWQIIH